MVGGATNQLAPIPLASSTAPPATTEEEEFLKRNTDCVYFLASPLTCKKGSECEYRHSDIARVNPWDCWYWLNGNCLNPKCGFRHPPFDGLLGAEASTPTGPSVHQAPVTLAPITISKQGVACIFFQKGFCLKGHLCPFLHGPPNIVNNKAVQPMPPNPVPKPSKMASVVLNQSIQEKKFTQQKRVHKPTKFLPPQGKQVPRVQAPALARNGGDGGVMEKKAAPPREEPPRYRPDSVVPPTALNEFPASRSNHGVYETHHVSDNEGILNGKDVDEYSREPTPGFDVLVDDELGESEYYPNEGQFGRSRGHTNYDVDRDMYSEQHDYDCYNGERYAWDDRRESTERILDESANFGRKRYPRDGSPDQFDKSDLRHRISKQKRGNALDPGSLSNRLRGRIKIPGRSTPPGNGNDSRAEREINMGRQCRQSHTSSNHRSLRDRIKGRGIEFSGPKRLSELKSGRVDEGYKRQTDDGQSLGKRKYPRTESQQSEDNLSFEGPKPLSEILKRKKGGSVLSSVNNDDNNSKEIKENNQKERKEMGCDVSEPKNKVGSCVDEDALLDQELEAYDHRDGDYDYEQIDGEDYNLDEGENPDEDHMEEEDETGKKENQAYS